MTDMDITTIVDRIIDSRLGQEICLNSALTSLKKVIIFCMKLLYLKKGGEKIRDWVGLMSRVVVVVEWLDGRERHHNHPLSKAKLHF